MIRLVPLGGLGEIGKNMLAIECNGDIVIVDCGLAFPDESMPGIDLVLPDFSYVLERKNRVKGVVLTHGHEDHIGGLPYFLRECPVPVYGTRLTLGLVRAKLSEAQPISSFEGRTLKVRKPIELGCFHIEPFRVNHSIADCVGLAIRTPEGMILHSGDFKFDQTPVDHEVADFAKLAALGDEGVLCLLSDSTNAERAGYTESESNVGIELNRIMAEAPGRVLVVSFASNVHRIQQVLDASAKHNRKVSVVGRSVENVVRIAAELGYLHYREDLLVDLDELGTLPPAQRTIITTGSQGEPMSALARMSVGENRRVQLEAGDIVVIAATPVPGNETMFARTVDNLFRRGVNVLYGPTSRVHVSGHGSEEELKLMLNLVRPRYFMPVHGEYRHLVFHARIAEQLGIPSKRILLAENGQVIEMSRRKASVVGQTSSTDLLVDGLGVGDVGNAVLRDRHQLARDGVVAIAVSVDRDERTILAGPELASRGFVYMRESASLVEETLERARRAVEKSLASSDCSEAQIRSAIREALTPFLVNKTGRRPTVMPLILFG